MTTYTHSEINVAVRGGILSERDARAEHSLIVAQEYVDRIRRSRGSFRVSYGPEIQADIDAGITGYKFCDD